MKETSTHIYFWGSIYSQWYKCKFIAHNLTFLSTEQWMMWSKATLFNDHENAKKIMKTRDPKTQKSLGREVKGFDSKIWDLKKLEIVVQGNIYKFSQNQDLKKQLLETGTKVIVEGSPYDKVWGVGLKWDDPKILDEKNWQGENLLGVALMEVRKIIKQNE